MDIDDPRDSGLAIEEPASLERREFLHAAMLTGAAVAAAAGGLSLAEPAEAQAPGTQPWWPSRWGKDDQVGATNHITPEKVLDAAKLIRDGKIYRIGRVSETDMPKFGTRAFVMRIPSNPTGGPFGDNKMVYNDEYLATEIGQTGTQFDGLGHIGIQVGKDGDTSEMRYYNGFTGNEVVGSTGLKKIGIENVKPIFTRGHLLDVAAVKGAPMEAGQEVTLADVRAAFGRQNMREDDVKPGDALFFNTGWGANWLKDNARYNSGEPGPGMEVARWMIDRQICVVGADNWAVEAVPNPDPKLVFAVHGELIAKNGIHIHENMTFDSLLADRKYQFVYIFCPVPMKGATGSPGGPIAVT